MRKLLRLLSAVIVMALIAAACGSDGDTTEDPETQPTAARETSSETADTVSDVGDDATSTADEAPSTDAAAGAGVASACVGSGSRPAVAANGYRRFDGASINVAMIDEPREWAFDERLGEFKDLTGIDVNIELFGFDDLFNKTLTASIGGTGEFDVYQFHFPDMALFDENGWFTDITDWVLEDAGIMELDDIHPAMQETHMKWRDRYFGVPTHAGGMQFYYRTDIFEDGGFAIPTNWYEAIETAKAIDEQYADEGVRGFAFMGRADIQGAATFQNILGGVGGDYFDEATGRPTMDSPEALEAMNVLLELLKYSIDESPSYGFDEAHVAFEQGRAAMMPFWDSGDAFFSNPDSSTVVGNWAVAPMPGGRHTNGGWSVQISCDSSEQAAAFEFLRWIISPEIEEELIPLTPSIRVSILEDPANAVHPSYPGFLALLEGEPFGFPRITPNLQVLQLVAEAQSAVTTGQKSPEEALSDLQTQMEVIFARFGIYTG